MPTESSPQGRDDLVNETSDDELTFAVHDLGREKAPEPTSDDLGFIAARHVVSPAQPVTIPVAHRAAEASDSQADGFVIRAADGVAPAAPVDALVVGAPEPVVREESEQTGPATPPNSFRIDSTSGAARAPSPAELWTTRNPTPDHAAEPPAAPSRRGWSTRHSEVVDRSAHATMLRLREEAVNVSWKSAWIAVTSCDPRLGRRRARQSPLY